MTYDHWKTADDTPEDEPTAEETELQAVYADHAKLLSQYLHLGRQRDALLAAAKAALIADDYDFQVWADLKAAIAKAEEQMP